MTDIAIQGENQKYKKTQLKQKQLLKITLNFNQILM